MTTVGTTGGRFRRLLSTVVVVALGATPFAVAVGTASLRAGTAGAAATKTPTPTGVLGSEEEFSGTLKSGQPGRVISMSGSLLEFGPVGESTAAFAPLNNQRIYFTVEDDGGDWWPLCSAVTDGQGIASCSAEAPFALVYSGDPGKTTPTKAYANIGAWGAVYQGQAPFAGSYDYGNVPGMPKPPKTPPGNGGITITPNTTPPNGGCKPQNPSDFATLGDLLTGGGNCQIVKIENYITMATLGIAATIATAGTGGLLQAIYDFAWCAAQDLVEIALSGNVVLANSIVFTLQTGFAAIATEAVPTLSVFAGTTIVGAGSLTAEALTTVPANGTFSLGTGTTLANSGVITNQGTITDGTSSGKGAGTIENTGTIVNNGSIPNHGQGNGGLLITGHNYDLTFDLNGGPGTQPGDRYVFARTLSDSQQSLPSADALPGKVFTGWYTAATGGTQVTDSTDLSALLPTGPSTLRLYAQYSLAQAKNTATQESPASVAYSASAQNVSLSAHVTGGLGTVNEGIVTFRVLDGTSANDATVGTPVAGEVVNGAASVVYDLPAGLPAGFYLVEATYGDPTGSLLGSGDATQQLNVGEAATTTTGVSSVDYGGSAQDVPVSAHVISGVGTVNEGTVNFVLQDGSQQSVTTSAPVLNGTASATLHIPATLQSGTYVVIGSYTDPGGTFGSSTDVQAGGLPQAIVVPNPLRTFVTGQSWYLPLPFSDSINNTFDWGGLDPASTGCTWNRANGTLSFVAIGTCILDATAPAEQGFAATPVSLRIPVGQGVDSTVLSPRPTTAAVGSIIPLTVTTKSGATPTLSVDPGSVGICTVANGSVALDAAGFCRVNATTPTTTNYFGATYDWGVTATLKTPVATVAAAPVGLAVGDTYFAYASVASTTNGFDVDASIPTFSIDPASVGVCTVSGRAVTFTAVGSCKVDVSFPASGGFAAVTSSQTIIVNAAAGRPTVSSVSPRSGPKTGGTRITVTGTGFAAGAKVVIGQGPGATKGGIAATNLKVVSPTKITAVTGGGAKVGTFNLYVTTAHGTSVAVKSDNFTYTAPPARPTVRSVTPRTGPKSGGTRITVTGTGFVAGAKVVIGQGPRATKGSIVATNVKVVSPTKITAVTGRATKPGTFNVFVTTAHGTSAAVKSDDFAYTH